MSNKVEKIYPLSNMQKGMLFHSIGDKKSKAYFSQIEMDIKGEVDETVFEESLNEVMDRHEILRASFNNKMDEPLHIILRGRKIGFIYIDISHYEHEEKRKYYDNYKREDKEKGFDISKDTLIRAALLKFTADSYKVVISHHHILMDGWSTGIILSDLFGIYRNKITGKPCGLKNIVPFSDYIKWLGEQDEEESLAYWKNYLDGYEEKVQIPGRMKEVSTNKYYRKEKMLDFSEELTNKLKAAAKDRNVTVNTMIQSIWGILLAKYNDVNDVVFGTVVSGRDKEVEGIEDMVGLFINTLPLRIQIEKEMSFSEVLKNCQRDTIKSNHNNYVSLAEIQAQSRMNGNLVDHVLVFENYAVDSDTLERNSEDLGFTVNEISTDENANFEFSILAGLWDKLKLTLIYDETVYSGEIIDQIGTHIMRIAEIITENMDIKIKDIDLLSDEEKNRILYEFNKTDTTYPRDKTIHELFEEQVDRTPQNPAIVFENEVLTYGELNERANRLSHHLRKSGIKADDIVGIMLERTPNMIVAILGILKSGGAYLPLDPDSAVERIHYMLEDSGAKILITQKEFWDHGAGDIEKLDITGEALRDESIENLKLINTSKDLAYIMYTSGSTGMPKGVLIEHQSVVNLCFHHIRLRNLTESDRATNYLKISVDAAVGEIIPNLLAGASLHILREEIKLDIIKISNYINQNGITIVSLPCKVCEQFIAHGNDSIRLLVAGGEKMKLTRDLPYKLLYEYGPTESTVVATTLVEDKKCENLSIGYPIHNIRIYIINGSHEISPIGTIGEICIAGEGLARGYLNNEELTKEKFIANPINPEERIYRTGDMAMWLPDGKIQFAGRTDYQVKIRGYRIELEEIESQLLNIEGVKEAVVMAREDGTGGTYLCAYLVGKNENFLPDESGIRKLLMSELPSYMIPSFYVFLDAFPLTPIGKVDKSVLPKPSRSGDMGAEYEPPGDMVEEKLLTIWKELLDMENFGVHHDYFQLGGHSLKAMNLISKIHKEFNAEIPIDQFFANPTIRGLGELIRTSGKSEFQEIKKAEESEYYMLSSSQRRLYILHQIDKDGVSNNIPSVMKIDGKLDYERFKNAFSKLVKRHEALRTSFHMVDGEPVQKIEEAEIDLKIHELKNHRIEDEMKAFIKPFDLKRAPLMRVELFRVNESEHYMFLDVHHIIVDGVSMGILTNDFARLYDDIQLPPITVQYKDFAVWENEMSQSKLLKRCSDYWLSVLSGELPVLDLPLDHERPVRQSFEGGSMEFKVDKDIAGKLKAISMNQGTTLYMVLLSAFNVLLSRYSGQDDIIVGTPIAGRSHNDLMQTVGMFVNNLPMRNYPAGGKGFEEFLQEVKRNSLQAYEHQYLQFNDLVNQLDMKRDLSRNPVYDVMFIMQNMDAGELKTDELIFTQYNMEEKISPVDLTLTAMERGDEINFSLEYCAKLFEAETIQRIAAHYRNLLEDIAFHAKAKLSDLKMLSEEEENKLLLQFNDTSSEEETEENLTFHRLFEAQAELRPDDTALVCDKEELSYKALNERANNVAKMLMAQGIGPDCIVGIMVERSFDMMAGILGILKSGGAYLPIDPEYPKERIEYMLDDSGAKILLTQSHLKNQFSFQGEIIDLDEKRIYETTAENPKHRTQLSDLAYVIYTSGSTGKPKGVMIEHGNLMNLIRGFSRKIELQPKESILALATFSFDMCIPELLIPLAIGMKIFIAGTKQQKDAVELEAYMEENDIDILHISPSRVQLLLNGKNGLRCFDKFKKVIVGAEELPPMLLKEIKKAGKFKLYNMYGPTETTVWSTGKDLTNSDNVNIGSPIEHTQVYILGEGNQLQPVGVIGELCISGKGLSRGYINKTELTKEKFVPNPFRPGERMYRTGDLARWNSDGEILCEGRIDNQVKIRGYRIEIGEIQNQLLKLEKMKEAAVICKEDKQGTKYLCAYLVCPEEITVPQLRAYLMKQLPEYMIPTHFIRMEELPKTPNGKLDRKSLPELDGNVSLGVEYKAPENDVEEKIAEIWSEVLDVEKIGVNDDFFALGGQSLKAMQMVTFIHRELDKEIPVGEIFNHPTIKQIARYIMTAKESVYTAIQPVEKREFYRASSAQKRMYALNQFAKEDIHYNIPSIMIAEGDLQKDKVEEVMNELVKRHEILRTSFHIVEDEVVQRIHDDIKFAVEYEEMYGAGEAEIEKQVKAFVRPFDLSKAPLIRIGLIKTEERKSVFMIDMHHIISDGTSLTIFTSEFIKLYYGESLSELKLQYKDYASWEREWLHSADMKKQENYWKETLSGELPVLEIPTDFERPEIQKYEGGSVDITIDPGLTDEIRKLGNAHGATLYMTLLSAYHILISKYSGQNDIIIGAPIAGRSHADLQDMIGLFINTLVLRSDTSNQCTYEDFLEETKTGVLKAFENQDYPLDILIETLDFKRDISRNPLFNTMFVLQNMDQKQSTMKDLKFKPYEFSKTVSKLDFSLIAVESDLGIELSMEYSTSLFSQGTIERMLQHYVQILRAITKTPEIPIEKISMLSEEEKKTILFDFNQTAGEFPEEKQIQELFEEQVVKTPGRTALSFRDETLTYEELNRRSNSLAHRLMEEGAKPEVVVGIIAERSMEMYISIMAVLKSGAAYLPIDPKYPVERIDFMLQDSKSQILIYQKSLGLEINFQGTRIDMEEDELFCRCEENPVKTGDTKKLAYIIYTSGSTGQPKGVMIEHNSVVNLLTDLQRRYPLNEDDSYLLKTNYIFDVSISELFGWFLNGGRLVILEPGFEMQPHKIFEAIGKNGVTHINFVPSMLKIFMGSLNRDEAEKLNSLKYLFTAGEAITSDLVNKIRNKINGVRLENLYGPTEATVYASGISLTETSYTGSISIGRPMQNTKLYIMGKGEELQPIGVYGELCIGGRGLARGYLNRPELTDEKFCIINGSRRIYRTGDLVRWREDGTIEFRGRMDQQVKIRGFRIELEEIENRLMMFDSISEAAVIIQNDETGNPYLCAYLVYKNSEYAHSAAKIRSFLKNQLPDYMIPSYYMKLKQLPFTATGKLDRKALPTPAYVRENKTEYKKPETELERKLVENWKDVLKVEQVGTEDNFFEMGGHSLKAMTSVYRIQKDFGVEIPLNQLFKTPTIKSIAQYIEQSRTQFSDSIQKAGEKEYYPLSAAQRRMYILNKLDEDSVTYNIPFATKIYGKFHEERMDQAFRTLIQRHEPLRTSFTMKGEEPVQVIHDTFSFRMVKRKPAGASIEEEINQFVRPFQLDSHPLLRAEVLEISEEEHILLFDIHHIISDGVSMEILSGELMDLYEGKYLPESTVQYRDYVEWQRKRIDGEWLKKQENYWVKTFEDEIPVLNLPLDYKRPKRKAFEGDMVTVTVKRENAEKIQELAKSQGATLYMVMLAAYSALLHKYTGQDDIVIGSPTAGRSHKELEHVVGLFINTLAMRTFPEGEKRFEDYLTEIRENTIKAFENQDYQFDELVERLELDRDLSRSAVFDTMLVLQNMDGSQGSPRELKLESYDTKIQGSKFDITLNVYENDGEIECSFIYCTSLFQKETIRRMAQHFINLLITISEAPDIRLKEISILSEEERSRLLNRSHGVKKPEMKKTFIELFKETAASHPDKTAVVFEDSALTYRELDYESDALSAYLSKKGISHGTVAGIMTGFSLELVIGILAIMKSGGIFLPIDADQINDRADHILKDSGAGFLLTKGNSSIGFEFKGERIDLEKITVNREVETCISSSHRADSDIYVIYTSGSTGKPKGVVVKDGNLVNYITWFMDTAKIGRQDKTLLMSSYAFDLGYTSLFSSLIAGAELHLAKKEDYTNSKKSWEYIKENGITYIKMTPSLFHVMVHDPCFEKEGGQTLRLLVLGGEKIIFADVDKFLSKNEDCLIMNHYGPTETTIGAAANVFDHDKMRECGERNIIGRPIHNMRCYVMDEGRNLQPEGVYGELYLSGDGVAGGYLHQPDLTKERFLPDPFCEHEIMYRTGDLVRLQKDGNIEFFGRVDSQVKVNGYRIEPEEIRSILLTHAEIMDAHVMVREVTSKKPALCAYYVSKNDLLFEEIRNYLKEKLPEYMIPSYLVPVEVIPLNANGKVNPKALPKPENHTLSVKYVKYRNDVEEKLAKVWEEVMGLNEIGIHHNFFSIGGDSIKALQIISRLSAYGLSLEMKDLFTYPEIALLSKHVKEKQEKKEQDVEIKGAVMLTPIQKSFFRRNRKERNHFNQAVTLYKKEGLDGTIVKEVFKEIFRHHDALRMTFTETEKGIIQTCPGADELPFDFVEYHYEEEQGIHGEEFISNINDFVTRLQKEIDIFHGPASKIALFRMPDGDHLLIVIHHLIVDGVSWRVLMEDFTIGYQQLVQKKELKFPSKTTSYQEYAALIDGYSKSRKLDREKRYWKQMTEQPVTFLDCNEYEGDYKYGDSDTLYEELSAEETDSLLRNTNHAYRTEINDILITALVLASKSSTGENAIRINLEGHGRQNGLNADISRTVGWFTTKYPLYIELEEEDDIGNHIKTVKETLRRVPDKGFGYGILKYMNKDPEFNVNDSAPILFNYLGQMDEDMNSNGFQASWLPMGESMGNEIVRENGLEINSVVLNHKLNISATFNNRKYDKEVIRAFVNQFKTELLLVIGHCSSKECEEKTPSDYGDTSISLSQLQQLEECCQGQEIEKIYPLANMQMGMLYHSLDQKDSDVYFEQMTLHFKGVVKSEWLEESFHIITGRHEILRASFEYEITDSPKTVILKDRRTEYHYYDLSGIDGIQQKMRIEQIKAKDKETGFDLRRDPLMRVTLIKTGSEDYQMIWSNHHILFDGWCRGLILSELFQIYADKKNQRPCSLEEVRPYSDYICWLNGQDRDRAEEYWSKYLDSFEQKTGLPVFGGKKSGKEPVRKKVTVEYDREMTEGLSWIANKNQVTLHTLIQCIWAVILAKYNRKEDVVFGTVVSGRDAEVAGIEKMVGLFINTLPSRLQPAGQMSFREFLKAAQKNSLESNKYNYMNLSEIQSLTKLKRDLMDHVMIFENYAEDNSIGTSDADALGFQVENFESNEQNNYDFSISVVPGERIVFHLKYDESVYETALIENVSKQLLYVAQQIISDKQMDNVSINELELIGEEEKNRLIYGYNQRKAPYPKEKTVDELFREQAKNSRSEIALVYEEKEMTYGELDQRSDALADRLWKSGVGEGDVVGILADRSMEMIVAILGILKSGCAYLPLDTEYPAERIEYMIKDSKVQVICTTEGVDCGITFHGGVIKLEELAQDKQIYMLKTISKPESLAYVIYTSGSSGKPKGVMLEHRNVNNLVHGLNEGIYKKYKKRLHVALLASYVFDGSVKQIFASLLLGHTLHIVKKDRILDASKLLVYFEEKGIEISDATPAHLRMLTYIEEGVHLTHLKELLVGGDILTYELVHKVYDKLKDAAFQMVNVYGPTECCVDSAYYRIDREGSKEQGIVPIGSPIQNTQLYILDPENRVLPVGIAGELCISGDGVSRGYLNRKELTEEKFVKNPFVPGLRMYTTGDLARRLADGTIEILGRIDQQVKIRGYRIEIGEIENKLLECDHIKDAAVAIKVDRNAVQSLCAYYVLKDGDNETTYSHIREYLLKYLPDYMIPSYFIPLETIPLNINGKVDRSRLPEPKEVVHLKAEYEAPVSEAEESLIAIWEDILEIDRIGSLDHLIELGINSLNVMAFVSRVLAEFKIRVPFQDVFAYPTVRAFANYLLGAKEALRDCSTDCIRLSPPGANKKNIFCFPPTGSIVMWAMALADCLEPFSVYSMNFIKDEDRLKQYADIILNIQQEGPFILLGYSAGGVLAFETAKELERRGYSVSDLILLDTNYRSSVEETNLTEKECRELLRERFDSEEYRNMENLLSGYLTETIMEYQKYIYKTVIRGTIHSSVNLILAEGSEAGEKLKWKEAAAEKFHRIQGFGSHHVMVDGDYPDYLKANAELIKNILD
nr:non-ribosomal peptide synthase/polyketide synthase [uncultured Clostridium sp.]